MTKEEFEENLETKNLINLLKEHKQNIDENIEDNTLYLGGLNKNQKEELKQLYLKFNQEQIEKYKKQYKKIDNSILNQYWEYYRKIRDAEFELDNLYKYRKTYNLELKEICENWKNQKRFEIEIKIKNLIKEL